jgi:hypothetical protein
MSTLIDTKRELRKMLTPLQTYCNSQNYNTEQTLGAIIEAVANWHLRKIETKNEQEKTQGLF